MSSYTIYHNPRCTKSRATLALLRERGIEPTIVEYLRTPPTAGQLRKLIAKLGIPAEKLVRKGEDVYRSRYAGRKLTDAQWVEAMAEHPVLIERPIVVSGERAVIGRPPESIAALLPKAR
jgi:arsenate reductase